MYQLRGHHLFCLLGFRGMGYSKEFAENMKKVHQHLRANPKTPIQIIEGPDHLCEKYPNDGTYHCKDRNIYERDTQILNRLGIEIGSVLTWEEIEMHIKKHAIPEDIHTYCENCSWRSYGVCEEGIKRILNDEGLWEIK
ncbi:MAG: DUF1284 domain-containing protein [Lysinibacillus sp.]|nr:DUF1284 domain-containing protein [Lysinibacillus sp.]